MHALDCSDNLTFYLADVTTPTSLDATVSITTKMPCADKQSPTGAAKNPCTGSCSRNGGICASRRDQNSIINTNAVPQIEDAPFLRAIQHDDEIKATAHSSHSGPSDRAGTNISRHRPRVVRRVS